MSITKNDNAVTLSRTALEYMAGLINKIVSAPEQLIDDVNLQTVTTFSSVRLNSLINETLQDAKDYTDEICGALVKLTCEKTTTQPTLSNSEKNVIYLYSSDGNAPFEQYLKISDTELIDMGSTSISLNDYLTVTDAIATYCKKTDFNSLVTEVDKVKTEIGTDTLTTTAQTLKGGINELNSGKIDKTSITTTISSTSTDEEVPSALALYNKTKNMCTTSVKDIPKTVITFTDTTHFEQFDTAVENGYQVKNGICYVNLNIKCNSTTINGFNIKFGMPKPNFSIVHGTITPFAPGGTGFKKELTFSINSNGVMTLFGGEPGCRYLGTFSYPVSES